MFRGKLGELNAKLVEVVFNEPGDSRFCVREESFVDKIYGCCCPFNVEEDRLHQIGSRLYAFCLRNVTNAEAQRLVTRI